MSEVITIEAGDVVFRRAQPEDDRAEAFSVLQERARGEMEIVGIRREDSTCIAPYAPCESDLVVVDVRTGAERSTRIVAPANATVSRYGGREAIFDTPPATPNGDGAFDVVIVDLDTMEVAWRGPPAAAPLPRAGRQCMSMAGVQHAAGGLRGERRELRVGLDGEGFAVLGAIECAITGDGDRLLLIAPRAIHLYALE